MESYLISDHFDLVTPDGTLVKLDRIDASHAEAVVHIEKIPRFFVGFTINPQLVFFNIKSTLAQLGLNGTGTQYLIDAKNHRAEVKVKLEAFGNLARLMLAQLTPGALIGKLFAADERRRVRNPDYLLRMFGRSDRYR